MASEKNDKLVLLEERDGFAVAWEVWDETYGEDIGSYLGDSDGSPQSIRQRVSAAKTPEEFDELEHDVASAAVIEFVAGLSTSSFTRKGLEGFRFERKSDAQTALKLAAAAVKALRERAKQVAKDATTAWPWWAVQAKEAGWKPPKGWKP